MPGCAELRRSDVGQAHPDGGIDRQDTSAYCWRGVKQAMTRALPQDPIDDTLAQSENEPAK